MTTPQAASPPPRAVGLVCRACGCRHFYTVYTRPKVGYILRRRECRNCGRRVMTREKIGW